MSTSKKIFFASLVVLLVFVVEFVSSCKPDVQCSSSAATTHPIIPPFRFPEMNIPTSNPTTDEGIELGRYLFFDSTLSINHQISCGSCHKPEHGFSDAGVKFSTNTKGFTKRNTPALLNTGFQNHYFFDGRAATLEDVLEDATKNELEVDWTATISYLQHDSFYADAFKKAFGCDAVTKDNAIKSMAQFMRTIISTGTSEIDEKFFKTNDYTQLNAAASRGFLLFTSARADCFHCHFTNILTSDNQFHNNGMQNSDGVSFEFDDKGKGAITNVQTDNAKMKTPTLRNLAYTAPYMSSGRFNTLREVVDFYADSIHLSPTLDANMVHTGNIRLNLTSSERDDLVAFMLSMTDSAMIKKPNYQNPFR